MKKWIMLTVFSCLASGENLKQDALSIFSMHINSNSIGSLLEYRLNQGIWTNISYAKYSHNVPNLSHSSFQSVLVQAGYDYALKVSGGQNFLGFGVDYSHSWLTQGEANSFAFALYDHFLHRSGFYVQPSLKYTFSSISSYRNIHALSANLELGMRLKFARFFFFQPLVSVGGGVIPSFVGDGGEYPIFNRMGGYVGVDFFGNLKGDLAFGGFYDADFFLDGRSRFERKNHRLLLELKSNLIINQNFRLFLGGKMSFLGRDNLDYGVNVGMRILFGHRLTSPSVGGGNQRGIKDVQREILREAEASRQRVEARTHLKPSELNSLYATQDRRDSPFVQDEMKYSKRQRQIRESSKWIDTKKNYQNYQKRTPTSIQVRDISKIKAYNQRELERKYGK